MQECLANWRAAVFIGPNMTKHFAHANGTSIWALPTLPRSSCGVDIASITSFGQGRLFCLCHVPRNFLGIHSRFNCLNKAWIASRIPGMEIWRPGEMILLLGIGMVLSIGSSHHIQGVGLRTKRILYIYIYHK